MSWWQRVVGGEEDVNEYAPEVAQGEKSSKGGVREDLSELTQSFSRGLRGSGAFGLVKGLGNFLAGEPLPGDNQLKSNGPFEETERVEVVGETHLEGVQEHESESFVQNETGRPAGLQLDAMVVVPGTGKVSEKAGVTDFSQPVTEQSPPKMRGLKADMSELTGTLSSSISRFSSVIKVVTGEDLLPRSPHRAENPGASKSVGASGDVSKPTAGGVPSLETVPPETHFENPNSGQESVSQLQAVDKPQTSARSADGVQKDLQALTGSIASGFSKLASRFPDVLSLVKREEEEELDPEAVGVTEEVVAFATSIASHPETWLDFPLSSDETAQGLTLTELQEDHVYVLEQEAPQIAAMRTELCPAFMSEERFWRVYFVLLASRLGNTGAAQLLTPEILAERKLLLEKLRKEKGALPEDNVSSGAGKASLQAVVDRPGVENVSEGATNKASQADGSGGPKQTSVGATMVAGRANFASETQGTETGKGSGAVKSADVSLSGPSGGQDEDDVDDWLDDDGEGGGEQGPTDPQEAEESSFSDLEEEEGASQDVVPVLKPVGTRIPEERRAASSRTDPARGPGWVELHRTASQGLKTVSSSSDLEHDETSGEGSPSSPAATTASRHGGSRTGSESGNEWLTVDAEDGRSTVS